MKNKQEDIVVKNIETPVIENEIINKEKQEPTYRKFSITREDICIASVLLSLGFVFLSKFLLLLNVTSIAVYIVFFCFGVILSALSMFFVFMKFRKEGKVTFTVELVLNLLALFLWLS